MRYLKQLILTIIGLLQFNNCFAYDFEVNGIYYVLNNTGNTVGVTYKTTSYNSYYGDIIIPDKVINNGVTYNVISIKKNAFNNCKDLNTIKLPESIISIEGWAFCNCEALKTINIPDGVSFIGAYAFYNCKSLTSISIPPNITSINQSTFERCSSLTDIRIPYGITSIGIRAFGGCSSLTDITIPGSVSNMEVWDACYAFNSCSSLKTITLERGLSLLGNQTFAFCSNVETVICKNIKPISVNNSFKDFANKAILYVPKDCKNTYASTNEWKDFKEIIELEEEVNKTFYLSIKSSGSGSVSYDGTSIKNKTKYFTVNESANVIISFSPDDGYRIKSVTINNTDVTASVSNNSYTINNISDDTTIEVEFEAITHTLTIKATGNGSATFNSTAVKGKSQAFTINEGSSATVTFTPDAGYRIKSVKLNTTDVTAGVVSNQYTISSINSDNTLEVEFEAITHTLTIKATGNGSATFNSTVVKGKSQAFTVNEGTSATVTFTPDAGYKIKSVKLNTTDVTASVVSNQYTISDINSDNTLEVEFEAITHTLTIKATGNGSATFNSTAVKGKSQAFTVNEGTSATVTFTPDAGYRIKSVKLNTTDVTASVVSNQYTISDINSDNTLEVEFEAITHTLTIKATGNGSATFNSTAVKGKSQSFTVNEGTSATVTFTPDAGYRIKSVKLNTTDVTSSVSDNQYTISNISSDNTLEVEFEVITHTLTIKATGNGSATFNSTAVKGKSQAFTVNEGTSATVTFTPDAGYRIKSVKLNTTDVTAGVVSNQYTISSINSDNTLEVEFEAITHTLTIKATGNGSATFNSIAVKGKSQAFTVNEGTSATITFTPDAGYRIKSVKLNTTDVTAGVVSNQYTISNINSDNTLEVEFEAIMHTLNIVAVGNGNIGYNGALIRNQSQSYSVQEGSSVVLSFTPDTGYRIAIIKENTKDVTADVTNNKYTISNFNENKTIEVTFEEIPPTTYTFTISAVGNGAVTYDENMVRSKTTSFTVVEGANVVVNLTADEGYRLKSVMLDNTDVTSSVKDNQYTIINIKANTTLEVTFEAIPTYSLNITASDNGSVTYNDAAVRGKTQTFTVIEGTSATVTFAPDAGYRIASVKLNDTDVTASVANNSYTISNITANTTLTVTFEEIPPTTYDLVIKVTGNGEVDNGAYSVRNKSMTFKVVEGSSVTVSFSPDEGNRLKSVKLDNQDVTSSVIGNQYTISNIKANTSLEVAFEAIPTYTLSIGATGSGTASYNGMMVRNQSKNFTLQEGSSAVVSFTADTGYRIKSVKVNDTDVSSSVSSNQYTISNITGNMNVEVDFEPITYYLSIKAIGDGSASFDGNTIRNSTNTFTVSEGVSAIISFSPDSGYRIKSVMVNSTDVTLSVSDNQYTISNITSDTSMEVEFEAIPINTYTLNIVVTGNGCANYNDTDVRNGSQAFTVSEGSTVTILFSPDNGNSLNMVKMNGTDVTSQVSGNNYTINSIVANTDLEVTFKEDVNALTVDGVNYSVVSQSDKTINVVGGNYGKVLTVPATVTSYDYTWSIIGIEENALNGNSELAAIIWNPEVTFTATVSNPNLLLYVKTEEYAPTTIQNVVVNGTARNIVLTEAGSNNGFYCPEAFTAQQISYTHNYQMQTGLGESKGWETIALPFDVQAITHETKGAIVPFAQWNNESDKKPFWLMEQTGTGFVETGSIKAYTPYIISMPNHPQYDSQWVLKGKVTFAASSVTVGKTENLNQSIYNGRTFIPCFAGEKADEGFYALNVNNDWEANNSGMTEGSKFVLNMRRIHPFEAYMISSSNAVPYFDVFDDMTTGIQVMDEGRWMSKEAVYDLQGRKLEKPSKKGVYIVNGKKMIIK